MEWKAAGKKLVPTPKRILFRPLDNTTFGGLWADVYLPSTGAPASGYPAAMYIHGGGVCQGNTEGILRVAHQAAQLLEAGILVVSIDYRLQPHVILSEICGDVQFGLDWVRQGGLGEAIGSKIDAERVGVFGHSSGGQLSSWLALTAQPPIRAVVDGFGWCILPLDLQNETEELKAARAKIINLPAASSTRERMDPSWINDPDQSEQDRLAYVIALFGAGNTIPEGKPTPAEDPWSLAKSPSPPFLVVHGTEDPAVPYDISVRFHQKLVDAGVDATLVPVPGAGHGWAVEKGAPGVEGERWDIDEKCMKWFSEKILA
ncbi:alpha/beta-hydrolase [Meredithblackwellia eburnea MCA 4105]